MNQCCILAFLGLNSWLDMKKRQISLLSAGIFAVLEIVTACYLQRISWMMLLPLGIGGIFLAVSILSRGALGLGDCWMILALGTALEFECFLTVLLLGLFASAAVAAMLFLVFRRGKHTEIPFVPFLLLGYIGGMLLW